MTDSSCMDSASPSLTKCYWLAERFVRIATGEQDASLMASKYRLPSDFESNERVITATLEDVDMEALRPLLYK